jgi:hypothetical protein
MSLYDGRGGADEEEDLRSFPRVPLSRRKTTCCASAAVVLVIAIIFYSFVMKDEPNPHQGGQNSSLGSPVYPSARFKPCTAPGGTRHYKIAGSDGGRGGVEIAIGCNETSVAGVEHNMVTITPTGIVPGEVKPEQEKIFTGEAFVVEYVRVGPDCPKPVPPGGCPRAICPDEKAAWAAADPRYQKDSRGYPR